MVHMKRLLPLFLIGAVPTLADDGLANLGQIAQSLVGLYCQATDNTPINLIGGVSVDICAVQDILKSAEKGYEDLRGLLSPERYLFNLEEGLIKNVTDAIAAFRGFDPAKYNISEESKRSIRQSYEGNIRPLEDRDLKSEVRNTVEDALKRAAEGELSPEEASRKIADALRANGEEVLDALQRYWDDLSAEVDRDAQRVEQKKQAYLQAQKAVEQAISTYGFASKQADEAVKNLRKKLTEYQEAKVKHAELIKLVNEQATVVHTLGGSLASEYAKTQVEGRREAILQGNRNIAKALTEDKSLLDLQKKVKSRGEELIREAQNATSTRAATQLLMSAMAEAMNAQVVSQAAMQKALAQIATQNVYTNQQLATIGAEIAAQMQMEAENEMAVLSAESSMAAARLQQLDQAAKGYDSFRATVSDTGVTNEELRQTAIDALTGRTKVAGGAVGLIRLINESRAP